MKALFVMLMVTLAALLGTLLVATLPAGRCLHEYGVDADCVPPGARP